MTTRGRLADQFVLNFPRSPVAYAFVLILIQVHHAYMRMILITCTSGKDSLRV